MPLTIKEIQFTNFGDHFTTSPYYCLFQSFKLLSLKEAKEEYTTNKKATGKILTREQTNIVKEKKIIFRSPDIGGVSYVYYEVS